MKLSRHFGLPVAAVAFVLSSATASQTVADSRTPSTVSVSSQATYRVTRPIRETRRKDISYRVMRPVREQRTKTVTYTQMTLVREQRTKTDAKTGKDVTYTVARHVPEQREKRVNYVVTTMISEQKHETFEYETLRFETTEVPRH